AILPDPFQYDLGVWEITSRKNGDEALGGVWDVRRRHVDHRVGTADERLLHEAHGGIIEDPHAFPSVRLDGEDAVFHGDPFFNFALPAAVTLVSATTTVRNRGSCASTVMPSSVTPVPSRA